MRPVLTPGEMSAFDAAAPVSLEELIERAGWAVAVAAREMLGGTYGRRVAVLVGRGNNGADGRVAARILQGWGAHCVLMDAADLPSELTDFALVIDAAYGTGLRGPFEAPGVGDTPVLAVDIPSGVDGLTGAALGHPLCATRTITFVAPKPGLLFWPGSAFVGDLEVADLDLPSPAATCHEIDAGDVSRLWPRRKPDTHKWRSSLWVVGGGPGMPGAPTLAAEGGARSGAGMVLLSIPGSDGTAAVSLPDHLVRRDLLGDWGETVAAEAGRLGAVVLGPGLTEASSPGPAHDGAVSIVSAWTGPLLIDASGLDVVAAHPDLLRGRPQPAVLTPHEAEFVRLGGRLRGHSAPDRLAATRRLAAELGAVVLLKGPTTVVADPAGEAWIVTGGDSRLATAGSGDVLAGIIGSGMAQGLSGGLAAALGAEIHGRAAKLGHSVGLTATDLVDLVATYLSAIANDAAVRER